MWPKNPQPLTDTEMWHHLRKLFDASPRVWLRRVERQDNGAVRCFVSRHDQPGRIWQADIDEVAVLRAIGGCPARQAHVFALCKAITTGRPVQAIAQPLRMAN